MALKTDRMEARLSPDERAHIERAATMAGESASSFMVNAAVARADVVIAELAVTVVPPAYFDALLDALDTPEPAPQLAKVAGRTRRRRHIHRP